MKVLYVTHDLNGKDGASRYSVDLITAVKKLGHEVRVITLSSPQTLLFSRFNFKPDIIHFLSEPVTNVLPFLNHKKVPICVTVHGTYAKNLLESKTAHQVDGFICVSNFTKNKFLNLFPSSLAVTVISNGIDTSLYKGIPRPNNSIKQILFVGGVKQRKGLTNSINALIYYAQKYSGNFIYNLVGKYDEDDPYYQELIRKDKIEIKFHGQVSQEKLLEFYQQADLFLMLPVAIGDKFEGFGLVYLEANACGVPVIGSLNSGAEDAILDGKTGYLVDPENPHKITEAIKNILITNTIEQKDCISWAKKNDISLKAKEVIRFYSDLNMS